LIHYNYIAIEGNIGAGKTSLATRIARQYNAKLILEQFEENSFLPKFYKNPSKYAFPLELSFLAERYQQLKDPLSSQDLFSDFTIADYFLNKSLIFASRNLEPDEFQLYARLFNIIESKIPRPDLVIYLYLNLDNLKRNILKRGRNYEKDIDFDYLDKIQKGYLEFFKQQSQMRVVLVDTNHLDFVNNEEDYNTMVKIIEGVYEPGIQTIELP
jgi:deoxyguanosine kinase